MNALLTSSPTAALMILAGALLFLAVRHGGSLFALVRRAASRVVPDPGRGGGPPTTSAADCRCELAAMFVAISDQVDRLSAEDQQIGRAAIDQLAPLMVKKGCDLETG